MGDGGIGDIVSEAVDVSSAFDSIGIESLTSGLDQFNTFTDPLSVADLSQFAYQDVTSVAGLASFTDFNFPGSIVEAAGSVGFANPLSSITDQAAQALSGAGIPSLNSLQSTATSLLPQINNALPNIQSAIPGLVGGDNPLSSIVNQSRSLLTSASGPLLNQVAATATSVLTQLPNSVTALQGALPAAVSIDGVAAATRSLTQAVTTPVQGVGEVQAFTSNAVRNTYDEAVAAAQAQAEADARNFLGPSITSENSFNSINVTVRPDGTYAAEYTVRAQAAVAPPTESPTIDPQVPYQPNLDNPLEGVVTPGAVENSPYQPNLDNPLEGVVTPGAVVNPPYQPNLTDPLEGVAQSTQAGTTIPAADVALGQLLRNNQTVRDQRMNIGSAGDWRVRLRLAPSSDYLYNNPQGAGILQPLKVTDGVIFPYTPQISTAYKANYDPYDLTHSNYRGYFYKSSAVDAISVKGMFTAQDTSEANYLLAVIHFFRSVTKMFYGQDPQYRGSPPPLVFLSGFGQYQFNEHPCVVSTFNLTLPSDVNYIRANALMANGTNLLDKRDRQSLPTNPFSAALQRLFNANVLKGAEPGQAIPPTFNIDGRSTYVPTKMDIDITLLPVQSRSQVSQQFSLQNFANGNLIKNGFW